MCPQPLRLVELNFYGIQEDVASPNNMKTALYALMMLSITSCTSYIWKPLDYDAFEEGLNKDIGKDFTEAYPVLGGKDLYAESENFNEYIYGRTKKCAWIVRVNKESNLIESWRFAYPDLCENYRRGN